MYLQRYENVVTSRYFVWNAVTQLVLLHNILRNYRGTMRVNELKIPSQSGNANSVAFYKTNPRLQQLPSLFMDMIKVDSLSTLKLRL